MVCTPPCFACLSVVITCPDFRSKMYTSPWSLPPTTAWHRFAKATPLGYVLMGSLVTSVRTNWPESILYMSNPFATLSTTQSRCSVSTQACPLPLDQHHPTSKWSTHIFEPSWWVDIHFPSSPSYLWLNHGLAHVTILLRIYWHCSIVETEDTEIPLFIVLKCETLRYDVLVLTEGIRMYWVELPAAGVERPDLHTLITCSCGDPSCPATRGIRCNAEDLPPSCDSDWVGRLETPLVL